MISTIALTGLVTLGSLTVLSVQGGMSAAGHDRHTSSALYAAESGAAAAMDYLRRNVDAGVKWSAFVEPNNTAPQSPGDIVGNGALPGDAGNLFATDVNAWYEVEVLNNLDDNGFAAGDDTDGRVIIRSTGHGPDGAVAQVEWSVAVTLSGPPEPHCPGYGQKGLSEDGTGNNDCLTTIVATDFATYTPGAP